MKIKKKQKKTDKTKKKKQKIRKIVFFIYVAVCFQQADIYWYVFYKEVKQHTSMLTIPPLCVFCLISFPHFQFLYLFLFLFSFSFNIFNSHNR